MPQVSVLLPAFNAAPTIDAAIASIRLQTYQDWELIVVDDGSSDATRAIAMRHANEDTRVHVLQRQHEGLVASLTAGLACCRGPWIARMDADDESLPTRLAEQVALLSARPDIDVCGCLVEFGGARTTSEGYALHVDWINSLVHHEEIALNRFIESPLAHPSVIFRRASLERWGGYRGGDFPEDYELWLRWIDAGARVEKVPRVLLRWNDPPHRLSRTAACYSPDAFFRTKAEWIARAVETLRRGRPLWLWGAGRPTRKRAAHLNRYGVKFAGYIDIDAKKTGRLIAGRPVIAPTDLPPSSDAFVLSFVSSRGARDLIRASLHSSAYREGVDFLVCA